MKPEHASLLQALQALILREGSPSTPPPSSLLTSRPSKLLSLPFEIRKIIWIYAVTEQTPSGAISEPPQDHVDAPDATNVDANATAHCQPIIIDRYNYPAEPNITRVCRQIRTESLTLFYSSNTFECWRPARAWFADGGEDDCCKDWLNQLGRQKRRWLKDLVLLYQKEEERARFLRFQYEQQELRVRPGTARWKKVPLSDDEQQRRQYGLPQAFGGAKAPRWSATGRG